MADRVQCGACGAEWPGGARWCGACGGALETEAPRPTGEPHGTVPERPWWRGAWRWALGVGVVAAVVAAVVVAGPVGGDGAPPVDDEGVALPDEEDLADPGQDDGNDGDTGSSMMCAPPGCEVWRFDDPVGPGVVAGDELVVHFTGDSMSGQEMVARDATNGRELWRRESPGPVSQNPGMTALSRHGLALVIDTPGGLEDESASEEGPRMRLSVHDPLDGSHRFDVGLDAGPVVGVNWIDQRLVVQTATTEGEAGNAAAFSPDGALLWEYEAAGPIQVLPESSVLLEFEFDQDRIRRIGAEDGEVAWEVAGGLAGRPDPEDGLLVFDRTTGLVHVVDLDDGATRTTVDAEGAVSAADLGPWVVVAHEEELRVHDRSSGRLLFDRERRAEEPDGGPMRMASAARVGDRVVVAWEGYGRGDEGLELEVRDHGGELERTVVVPEPDGARSGPARGPVALRHFWPGGKVVFVSAPGPTGTTVVVDLGSGEVLQRWSGMPVADRDDLLALRREDGVSILGPGGELQVEHVREVASTDPLVVYGVGGIMRLDRSLVAGEDA